MSCFPCGALRGLPLCRIHEIINKLYCILCGTRCTKRQKYEDYRCAVQFLAGFSVDPRGGYAAFLGLRDNDPTKFAAIYIDNIRGEFDPNLNANRVYHVAFVAYGDTNAICRALRQKTPVIAGNADALSGLSDVDGVVSQKVFRSQGAVTGIGEVSLPVGLNMPEASAVLFAPAGTPEDIYRNSGIVAGY